MADQQAAIEFLSRPETYGTTTPVERVETHASIVFLAGDRAYKLKKSVRYSYLDYATLDRREAACRAEFRINRAFAPALYLGVEPIARTPDGLVLGGSGEAIDWVVVMRRFPAAAQFDRIAESGGLDSDLAIALGDRIAALHDAAAIRTTEGGSRGLRHALELTIGNLRLAAGSVLDAEAVDRWSADAGAALARHAALLDWRRARGRVRECHGDLHLQNICLLDGVPVPFDAIEFDPAISCIDTLYDLAFLLMDLEHRGLRPAGNTVFNRYLDRREEADGLPSLPLFLSLRAAIRAQVRAAAARQPAASPATAGEAQAYLARAQALLVPGRPRLIAIGGFSGSGKSTLARRLAPALGPAPGARVVRSDAIRKRLAAVAPETTLPASSYTPDSHRTTHAALVEEARLCLSGGGTVIADAVHGTRAERAALEKLAAGLAVPFLGVWLDAPSDRLHARLAGRRNDASDASSTVLDQQSARIVPPTDWPHLDAGGDPDSVARRATALLSGCTGD